MLCSAQTLLCVIPISFGVISVRRFLKLFSCTLLPRRKARTKNKVSDGSVMPTDSKAGLRISRLRSTVERTILCSVQILLCVIPFSCGVISVRRFLKLFSFTLLPRQKARTKNKVSDGSVMPTDSKAGLRMSRLGGTVERTILCSVRTLVCVVPSSRRARRGLYSKGNRQANLVPQPFQAKQRAELRSSCNEI